MPQTDLYLFGGAVVARASSYSQIGLTTAFFNAVSLLFSPAVHRTDITGKYQIGQLV